jgi:hypothetical protein
MIAVVLLSLTVLRRNRISARDDVAPTATQGVLSSNVPFRRG